MVIRVWHAAVGPAGIIRPAEPVLPPDLLPAGGAEPEPDDAGSLVPAVARTLAPEQPGRVTDDEGLERPVRTRRYWRSPYAWVQI